MRERPRNTYMARAWPSTGQRAASETLAEGAPMDRTQTGTIPASLLRTICALLACAALAPACGGNEADPIEDDQDFTSDAATLLQFEFDGEVLTASNLNLRSQVKA